jgi:CHRD domain
VSNSKLFAASVAAVAAAVLLSSCASLAQGASEQKFQATLSVVNGIQSPGTGTATFVLSPDGTSLSYTLSVSDLSNVTMAHIHVSTAPGQSGEVAVWLYPDKAPPILKAGVFNGILAQGTITAANLQGPLANGSVKDLVDKIMKGLAYVNVHTQQNPAGEIRGTIVQEPSNEGHTQQSYGSEGHSM